MGKNVANNPPHYTDTSLEPWDVIHTWGFNYFEGNILKYLKRWRTKDGLKDLYKCRNYIDKLIAIEEAVFKADAVVVVETDQDYE